LGTIKPELMKASAQELARWHCSAPTKLVAHEGFLLSPNWRYRKAELNIHLINQTDMLTVPLPERLQFLYPILRLPLWVWRHVARRRERK
jgi:hypothetical protein